MDEDSDLILNVNTNVHVESLRSVETCRKLVDSLALISMQLLEHEQRIIFKNCDGLTTLVNYLLQMWEEQGTRKFRMKQVSESFGFRMAQEDVEDFNTFAMTSVCHACLDAELGCTFGAMVEGKMLNVLMEQYSVFERQGKEKFQRIVLEIFRNVLYADENHVLFPTNFIEQLQTLAIPEPESNRVDLQDIALCCLCNLASMEPKNTLTTHVWLCTLIRIYFDDTNDVSLRTTVADLICNLAQDFDYSVTCLLQFDEHRPEGYDKHSGIVYVLELTELFKDVGLQQATDAMCHNVAWSDRKNKRRIQRLGICQHTADFIHVETIKKEQQAALQASKLETKKETTPA